MKTLYRAIAAILFLVAIALSAITLAPAGLLEDILLAIGCAVVAFAVILGILMSVDTIKAAIKEYKEL